MCHAVSRSGHKLRLKLKNNGGEAVNVVLDAPKYLTVKSESLTLQKDEEESVRHLLLC